MTTPWTQKNDAPEATATGAPSATTVGENDQGHNAESGHAEQGCSALDYALADAAQGLHVFPAPATGEKKSLKSAKYSNGARWGATNDPEQIRRDFLRWPNANVGIVCGAGSGIWVLDIDKPDAHKRGHDGFASLRLLEIIHGTLPATLTALSPSGSQHRYFKHPGGDAYIKNSDSEIAPGIDVRGDGGMVLAPPSNKPGKGRYTWLNALPVADAPYWLLTLVMQPRRRTRTATGDPALGNARVQVHPVLVAAAVREIPNDDAVGWEAWNTIGMAIWAATGGSAAGFKIFDEWSEKNRRMYSYVNTEDKWSRITGCPPTEVTFGTLVYLANQANPDWSRAYDAQLEAVMAAINEASHD